MQTIRKSKKRILVLNLLFLVLMILFAYTTVYAVPLAYDLSVDLSPQKVSLLPPYDYPCAGCPLNQIGCQWCWAASCQSGIDYVCSYTSIRSVVASVKGSYICQSEYNNNIPSHINSTYGGWGLVSTYYGYKPSSSTVKSYIYNSHAPIVANIGGHDVLISGYFDDGSVFNITYMDPWYPRFTDAPYSTFTCYNIIKIDA